MSVTPKRARWDNKQKILVVSGNRSTPESLAAIIDGHRIRRGVSMYQIAQGRSFSRDAVIRMLGSYRATRRGDVSLYKMDSGSMPGRVRLVTFLGILESLGLDVEIVSRSGLGRGISELDV